MLLRRCVLRQSGMLLAFHTRCYIPVRGMNFIIWFYSIPAALEPSPLLEKVFATQLTGIINNY